MLVITLEFALEPVLALAISPLTSEVITVDNPEIALVGIELLDNASLFKNKRPFNETSPKILTLPFKDVSEITENLPGI